METEHAKPVILVVEDSAAIRRIIGLLLEGHGYEIVPVASGKEGLDEARKLKPAAITLDISLQDMDGRDVLRELKADPATQDIPVFVVSACVATLTARERATVAEVLTKPFDVDELLEAIAGAVGERRQS